MGLSLVPWFGIFDRGKVVITQHSIHAYASEAHISKVERWIAPHVSFLAAGYEWIYDMPGKYLLEGKPTVVKIYAARKGLG